MTDFDLKSYTDLFLKNARQEIQTLRGLLGADENLAELHRVSHSLKGQSYFMNFNEIGNKAKDLEFFFKALLDKKASLTGQTDYPKNILVEIENLLKTIKV